MHTLSVIFSKECFKQTKRDQEEFSNVLENCAGKQSHLASRFPYIAIPCERLIEYVNFPDFQDACIKKVQTIGTLRQKSGKVGEIVSIDKGYEDSLKKYTEQKYITTIFEAKYVFKVFGILRTINNKCMIEASFVKKVENVNESEAVLKLGSKLGCCRIDQYEDTFIDIL